ncbi:IPT/TIG domain-containing protein [Streptomyces sp. NPDC006700]|uniref:IPT/TIG domain-containing protein n=1 Tax=unclassified Streptomyces TaxID=2593676 RepID=UPI0033F9AFA1
MMDEPANPTVEPPVLAAVSQAAVISRAVQTVPVGIKPLGLGMGPLGLHAYVTNSGSGTTSVVDIGQLVVSTALAPYSAPAGVGVSPDSSLIYVAENGANALSTAEQQTLTVLSKIEVGSAPFGIAVSPAGIRVYVADQGSDSLTVVDTFNNSILTTIPVGAGPTGVAVSPTGGQVYVTNHDDNTLSVIDTATFTVVATIPGLSAPVGVAASTDTLHLYAANSGANTLSVIDTASQTITTTIPVGTTPWGVAITPDSSEVYVSNNGSDTVSIIDATTGTVTDTIAVGHQPAGIAVTPNGLAVFVANSGSNSVSVIQALYKMAPTLGPQSGGTKVTITGTNLSGVTAVQFGTSSAAVIANTPNKVVASSPPGSGTAPVTVTTAGGTSNPKPFQYYPSGHASSLSPAAGPTAGRNIVTINGALLATATQVLFGTLLAVPQVVSDQQLTVDVPPAASPGTVPVSITTAGGLTTGRLSYTYVDPPQFGGLSATSGPVAGGTVVDLTGKNLTTTAAVSFNGVFAQFSIGSDTVLAAIVPPGSAPGPVDVTVTTAGGSATLPDAYTYT